MTVKFDELKQNTIILDLFLESLASAKNNELKRELFERYIADIEESLASVKTFLQLVSKLKDKKLPQPTRKSIVKSFVESERYKTNIADYPSEYQKLAHQTSEQAQRIVELVDFDFFDKYSSDVENIHTYELQKTYEDGAIDMFNAIMKQL